MAKKVNTKANEEVKEEEVDVDMIEENFEETTEAEEETEPEKVKTKEKKPGFFKTKILPKAEKALEIVGGIALVMGVAYGIKVAISAGVDKEDYETNEETDETNDNVIPFPDQDTTAA